MVKKGFLLLVLLATIAQAKYVVYYRGFSIAETDSLDSVHQEYLRLKVTSKIYRFITGKPYVCYYFGEKPNFEKTKFHIDYQRYLAVFKMLVEERPQDQDLLVCGENNVNMKCPTHDECSYVYYEAGKLFSKGKIKFDQNDKIVLMQDDHNHAKIVWEKDKK